METISDGSLWLCGFGVCLILQGLVAYLAKRDKDNI